MIWGADKAEITVNGTSMVASGTTLFFAWNVVVVVGNTAVGVPLITPSLISIPSGKLLPSEYASA